MRPARSRFLASIFAFVLIAGTSFPGGGASFAQAAENEPESLAQQTGEGLYAQAPEDSETEGTTSEDIDVDGVVLDDETDDGAFDEVKSQVLAAFENNPEAGYVEGEVIVVFKSEVSIDEASEILEALDTVNEESLTEKSLISEDAVVVELSEGTSIIEALVELNENPNVAFAQPNYLYQPLEAPENEAGLQPTAFTNDPLSGYQWALTTTRAYDAWSLTRADSTVSVAVIDTGVNTSHEDLINNIIPNTYYDATKTGQVGDNYGHGTNVAGVIAAQANNGLGVVGVSYNARIIPICSGMYWTNPTTGTYEYHMTTEYVVAAYKYLFSPEPGETVTRATKYNLKVINISLGGEKKDPLLELEINSAYDAGVLTVGAAGNVPQITAGAPCYPGAFENCVNVTALKEGASVLNDIFDSGYSNYGSTVNISAPGTAIRSTSYTDNQSYGNKSGTSFAAPFVSGVAALLFAANPDATPADVREALESTAEDLGAPGWDAQYGHGEVNPYAAALHIGVSGIDNEVSEGIGLTVACWVRTTLPQPITWQWSVVAGSGTIDSGGILIPSAGGPITVQASLATDSSVYLTKTIEVPYEHIPIITISQSSYTYDGTPKEPAVSVRYKKVDLVVGVDFSVAYAGNTGAGQAKVIITGCSEWTGTEERSFTIEPTTIASANISVSNAVFAGGPTKAEVVVKFTKGNGQIQTLVSSTDYTVVFSNNAAPTNQGALATVSGKGNFKGTATRSYSITSASITYSTHVQNVGWQSAVGEGQVSGTTGSGLRLEGLMVNLTNNTGYSGSIRYSTHVQNIGWLSPVSVTNNGLSSAEVKGPLSGTTGRSLRLEALTMEVTGDLARYYSIYYRVHAQNAGWLGWAKDGEQAGTVGYSLRLEAIQVVLIPKGSSAPPDSYKGVNVSAGMPRMVDSSAVASGLAYSATVHVENIGDQMYSNATGSTILGTSGRSLRLEAVTLSLKNVPFAGGLNYSTHVQNLGWQGAVSSGQKSGTSGKSLRLEAIRINLTGTMAQNYDVYYRAHIQNIGWTGWAKNGQSCGSAGYAYRMEAMQIVVLPKGGAAPGINANYFYQRG